MGYSDEHKLYWFSRMKGAEENGYDFETADELLNAKVFDGKSMAELWDKIEFDSINVVDTHTWAWRRCWNSYTAREKDYEKIARLACELWPHHTFDEMCDEIKKIIASENDMIFTLYCYKEMVGFAHCSIRNDYVEGTGSSPVGYLEAVFVKEEWRNLGFATELVICCQNWAKEKGCKEFASDCELDNTNSFNFHMAMGFEEANRVICFRKEL